MNNYYKIFFVSCLLVLVFADLSAQSNSLVKKFRTLSRPEKCWVMCHPFVAKKTWAITQSTLNATDSIAKTTILDGDKSGGQVDAFRHAYWMALLSKNIGAGKALRLGRAHEKANYLDYKKRSLEDGVTPDKASSEMDIWNNMKGADIGTVNKDSSEICLQQKIINAIIEGRMKIIKKDNKGYFLDEQNNIIPIENLKGKWDNGKCLVGSDWKY